MASHVRYLLKLQDGYHKGAAVFSMLTRYSGAPVQTRAEAIQAAKQLHAGLWIFREPRGVSHKRSRYKAVCRHFNLRLPLGKKMKKGGLIANLIHGANPVPGPPAVANGYINLNMDAVLAHYAAVPQAPAGPEVGGGFYVEDH